MANQFRKNNGLGRFGLLLVASVVMLFIDANTAWLNTPRNILSVGLRPIQAMASVPAGVTNWFSGAISAEPDVKIAYENLRNEYFKLKSEALLLRTLQEENAGLRALLDATERLEEKVTLAELMQVNLDRDNHRVSIRQGLNQQVYVGQAVIDDKGVIGFLSRYNRILEHQIAAEARRIQMAGDVSAGNTKAGKTEKDFNEAQESKRLQDLYMDKLQAQMEQMEQTLVEYQEQVSGIVQ